MIVLGPVFVSPVFPFGQTFRSARSLQRIFRFLTHVNYNGWFIPYDIDMRSVIPLAVGSVRRPGENRSPFRGDLP